MIEKLKKLGWKQFGGLVLIVIIIIAFGFGGFGGGFSTNTVSYTHLTLPTTG